MPKLCQILAIEKQTKSNSNDQLTQIYQAIQKEQLLSGISRTYKPLTEEGERFPPEKQEVQLRVVRALEAACSVQVALFDITATKDAANRSAKGDVEIDGKVILKDIPAVTLLFLEKQLQDFHTVICKLPELPQTETWTHDKNADCYVTEAVETSKSKKITKPLVAYPATEQHPAQVQLVTEDIVQGNWTTIKFSGAIPRDVKRRLRDNTEKLMAAVKFAREAANQVEAPKVSIAREIFEYLLAI